ncbi:hypothetical protein N0V95_009612 [Ascochyta clinopodiicola]|nr:hypothetical protein N0V95_009612 [Ascochyta clinopodiicola]
MFRWYQRASKCYVYLSDVSVPENLDAETFQITWLEAFRRSRWFTRGWTLQELLAPASVEFFSKEGKRLGSKISLKQEVCRSARLPAEVLRGQSLSKFSVEERLGWASTRTTTLKEDKVYCLLGIFEVFLPLIYGGGEAYATVRLKEEIRKRQNGKDLMNNNTSAVTARPNASPRPSCVVPFRQDPDFVDRGTLLEEIRKKCYAPASRVALVGLGGVGKSQLAIEHCYRTSERSPETWVFWVHASNAARIEQGYQAIADQVKISGRHDPQADVFQLVHNWLRNEENGKWLLVLDNVDDATVLALPASSKDGAHATPRSFTSYLPPSKHGAVLVTSRTRTAASHLVEDDEIIAIEPMNNVSAQALLRKKLGTESDERTTAELTTALECMPLAIVQAAAYIRQRAPRCSVQQYLADFHKSDRKKTSLLDYDGGRLRRDGDAKNSILLTWQISFDHIRDVRPSAADLLSLMSFFDRQGIPEEALRSQPEVKRSNESADPFKPDSDKSELEESIDNGFEDDISMLTSYFIVSLTTGGTAFDMHRLVQLATRRWLREQGKFEFWNDRFIGRLSAVFPKVTKAGGRRLRG